MRAHCSSNTKECERRRSRKRCAPALATAGRARHFLQIQCPRARPASVGIPVTMFTSSIRSLAALLSI